MPIYGYQVIEEEKGCDFCSGGFEIKQAIQDKRLDKCPRCGAQVRKILYAPALGHSQFDLDYRAKRAGFSKLKRLGKGEYSKEY